MAHEQTKVKTSSLGTGSVTTNTIKDGAITSLKIDSSTVISNTKSGLTASEPTFSSLTPTLADPNSNTTITITGTNFVAVPQVWWLNTGTGARTRSGVVSFTSSTEITAQFQSGLAAGTYQAIIENATGLGVKGSTNITYSIAPNWITATGTLGTIQEGESVSTSVLAVDDDSTAVSSYAVTSGALPSGVSLNASTGAITGTMPLVNADTTYNFTITATDDESQQTARAFSLTAQDFAITHSAQFYSNTVLKRTNVSTSTNQKTGAFSTWIKKCNIDGTGGGIISGWAGSSSNATIIYFDSDHRLCFYEVQSGSTAAFLRTPNIFKDPSAWYHIAYLIDTTQATAADRVKCYVNGTQITSFHSGGTTQPAQDLTLKIFAESTSLDLGQDTSGSPHHLNGYLCETVFIDGTAKVITDFGEFDSDSPSIWKPVSVAGLSGDKGANGFYLDYKDSATLGNCAYGGTDFTNYNLTATDQATDTPVNNFCTMNPLTNGSYITLTEGNLLVTGNSGTDQASIYGTLSANSGKWYAEAKITVGGTDSYPLVCISHIDDEQYGSRNNGGNDDPGRHNTASGCYRANGDKRSNNVTTSSWGNTFDDDDIISIAIDCDNGATYVAKNGTWENSGDPTSGASKTGALVTWTPANEDMSTFSDSQYNSSSSNWNFGSPTYANSSDAADANGYGAFEYAPPTGYFALCTKNLAEYG